MHLITVDVDRIQVSFLVSGADYTFGHLEDINRVCYSRLDTTWTFKRREGGRKGEGVEMVHKVSRKKRAILLAYRLRIVVVYIFGIQWLLLALKILNFSVG